MRQNWFMETSLTPLTCRLLLKSPFTERPMISELSTGGMPGEGMVEEIVAEWQ